MTGRRVLVAGATGPIGGVVARELAEAGYRVAVHCRSRRDVAEEIVAALPDPSRHTVVQVDLTDPGALALAVTELEETWGSVEDFVNAAWPAVPTGTIAEVEEAGLDAAFLGARAHAHACRAVLPGVRRARGAIVLLGGALASRLHPGLGLFGAGKAAATVFTHVLALEEGASGVRANVVSPGRVSTGAADLAEDDPVFAALEEIGALRRSSPLPTSRDVAATVRWLLAPESAALTGQTITLAGGERV